MTQNFNRAIFEYQVHLFAEMTLLPKLDVVMGAKYSKFQLFKFNSSSKTDKNVKLTKFKM